MKNKKKSVKVVAVDTKKLAANDRIETTTATKALPAVSLSVRSEAAKRTSAGKFTKVVFVQIGGKECPRFAPMTWKERDAFMAKPENAAVKARYEAHLASVK
jgi:hypothetical protein